MDWVIFTALLTVFVVVGTFLVWAFVHADILCAGLDKLMANRDRRRARRSAGTLARQGYILVLHEPAPERDRSVTWTVEDWYEQSDFSV